MICVKASSIFSSSTRTFFTPSKSFLQPSKPFLLSLINSKSNSKTFCSRNFPAKMSAIKAQTIEHFVLFKVKEDTDQSKINSMINGLNGLISLDQVLYLSAGPIFRNRSSSFNFTHLLHSRYRTKDDLSAYSANPKHQSVVKETVLPICEDIMAVDWVADLDESQVVPKSGSAMRVTFLKLKEELGDGEKGEVLGVIGGIKDQFNSIEQISFGENFSPARAKGFSIASVAIFPGLSELDALDSNEEAVKAQKEKVKDLLDSVIVVDYVIPTPQSANL